MPFETCSCGAQLVEDARFCHRCGKDQRPPVEAPLEAVAVPEVPDIPAPAAPPRQLPINFRNTVAVRIGLFAASIASMFDAIPFLHLFFILWSTCAGFFSVALYRRTAGQDLSIASGARMGWITGVLNSVIVIVLFTLTLATDTSELAAYRDQLTQAAQKQDPANYAKLLPIIQSPYTIAFCVLVGLFFVFLILTIASIAGGALGARVTRKD